MGSYIRTVINENFWSVQQYVECFTWWLAREQFINRIFEMLKVCRTFTLEVTREPLKWSFQFLCTCVVRAANICILQLRRFCKSIGNMLRTTFNIMGENCPFQRDFQIWKDWFIFRELSAESRRVGSSVLCVETIHCRVCWVCNLDMQRCWFM